MKCREMTSLAQVTSRLWTRNSGRWATGCWGAGLAAYSNMVLKGLEPGFEVGLPEKTQLYPKTLLRR